jgi:excisionase family DNA binding protein
MRAFRREPALLHVGVEKGGTAPQQRRFWRYAGRCQRSKHGNWRITMQSKLGQLPDEFWTVKQAAEYLGVSPARVKVFVEQGRLPAVKLARDWMLSRDAVIKFAKIPRITGRPVTRKESKSNG